MYARRQSALEGGRCQGAIQTNSVFIYFLVSPSHPRSYSELLSAAELPIISVEQDWWRILSCLSFFLFSVFPPLFFSPKQTTVNAFGPFIFPFDLNKRNAGILLFAGRLTKAPSNRNFTLEEIKQFPVLRQLSKEASYPVMSRHRCLLLIDRDVF